MGKYLGIDYGAARIGVSLSDPFKILASPLTTLHTEKKIEGTADKVAFVIKENNVEKVVIGIPYHMNGKVGMQADEVREFIRLLKEKVDCEFIEWDERLTTVQAERIMREGKSSRKKRTKVIDVAAAVIILQSFLDTQGNSLLSV
jgi:putative holliday junction resolvase